MIIDILKKQTMMLKIKISDAKTKYLIFIKNNYEKNINN